MAECYMCSKEATSRDHIPPKCIFPETKDLPIGVNYRKNLIKLPSCAEHNLQKSGDDEYLLFFLVGNFNVNLAGLRQWETKIKRSMNQQPAKKGIYKNPEPVVIQGIETGIYEIDYQRLQQQFDRIIRGIYYHHFQKHCPFTFDIVFPSAISIGVSESERHNRVQREFTILTTRFLQSQPLYGDNPEIFYYQHWLENGVVPGYVLKMVFYGGIEVVASSIPEIIPH